MLQDAKHKAEEILKNAEVESEKIKKSSKDSGYQEGYKNGYKDGYDFGIKEADSEGVNIRKAADDYRSSCVESVKQYLSDTEQEIIHLAVAIAKQIVNTELTINPEAIFKIAEKVVSKAVDRKQIVLKVNPKDFVIIKNKKDELSIYVENSNNIFLIADSTIKQGSIKAETPSGYVDADIDVQIDTVLKSLLGE
jgi:flagellar assembly protein FliH